MKLLYSFYSIYLYHSPTDLRSLHTESEIFESVFQYSPSCMQKRRKSNLIRIFFDGRKFRRQCANVFDTTWGRINFLTCGNFRQKFRTQCAETFTLFVVDRIYMQINYLPAGATVGVVERERGFPGNTVHKSELSSQTLLYQTFHDFTLTSTSTINVMRIWRVW